MDSTAAQIVKAYEASVPIDEIANEQRLSEVEIKVVLLNYSSLYRHDMKKDRQLDFTDDDQEFTTQAIREIARTTDNEELKFRALKYMRDDKKGRLDILKGLQGLHINVFEFNAGIRKVQASRERTLSNSSGTPTSSADSKQTIDID